MNADPGAPRDSRNIAASGSAGVAWMQLFVLESCQWLPRTPDEIFHFYADAFNLEQLTPPWLRFQVVTSPPVTMVAGAEIDYRLRLHGFRISWRSRITAWEPPFRFVDEQIRGPYRRWAHQHTFVPQDGGTCVQDRVEYGLWGGWLTDRLLVRRDLRTIFQFRQQRLAAEFGTGNGPPGRIDF